MLIILLGMKTWNITSDEAASRDAYASFYTPTAGFFLYMDQFFYLASQWYVLESNLVGIMIGPLVVNVFVKIHIGFAAFCPPYRILLMFCLERCVAVTFPLFHYTKKRRCFGGITVTVVFALSALIGILVPVLYYWNLSATGSLKANQPVRRMPYSMALWREVDSWWEVRSVDLTYSRSANIVQKSLDHFQIFV